MADGVELATAWVRLVPSVEGITDGITKAVVPSMGPAGKDAGKRFGSGFKGAASGFLTGAVFLGVAAGVKSFVTESVNSLARIEKINTQTETVIKSTGNAAGVSAKHVEDLAGALENTTATEAEATQEGANLLLTFKNIRNGVGKGNDVFDQSTKALVDMSRAMGTEPKAAAMQLGKALNDPVKGITQLTRVGVTFSEEQQNTIKSMVEMGDTAGAQKIMLEELNSQFGGSGEAYAKTYAGQMELLGHSFGTLGETIMGAVMPALQGFMSGLVPVFQWLSENQGVLLGVAAAIGVTLVAAFVAWTASIWASTVALLANPMTWIVLGIMALIAAIVLLVANWDTVVAWISEVWAGFISWITGVIDGFVEWWTGVWSAITQFFTDVWNNVVAWVTEVWSGFISWITGVIDGFVAWWNGIWNSVGQFFSDVWTNVSSFFRGIWDGIVSWFQQKILFWQNVFKVGLYLFVSFWSNTWNNITSFFRGIWNGIVSWFQEKIAFWQTVFRLSLAILRDTWQNIWNGIKTFFSNIWNGIKSVFMTMINFVKTKPVEAFKAARDAIGSAWKGIQELAKKPVRFVIDTVINGLIGTVNKILPKGMKIPKIDLPKGFAVGGILPGMSRMSDGDSQLIAARPGEGVMVSEALRSSADKAAFLAANAAGRKGVGFASMLQGFARGGLVNPLPKGSYSVSQPYHGGHNGIDLAAASGTRVYAAADGVVGLAGSVNMGGNEVYIQHGNGLGTRYSHLSRFATSAGTKVKAGNVIGYVGSTGMSTGPHLHYMVHNPGGGAVNYGSHVNPAPYLGIYGKDLGEAGGAASILDGLVDWAVGKIKSQFPGGGLWVDVATAMAKNAAGLMSKAFNPFAAADGHTALYDDGGFLPTGISLVENKTGRPEPVFSPSQWSTLHAAVDAPERGDGEGVFHLYDSDGVLFGTIDGRIAAASSAGSDRVLNDRLGVR
ncbi:peptidoglycan DD-metalloendopeptidase family protein [Leucobacter chromiiresistens]|uniref:Murein DD-endopeptidase MepM and murein hydrolase activator NlpD, contain LysM domain n=1 Tax=Leucobacter chromiiresistens TaxID=1079994 RepID=A0A1H0XQR9_9MICO|nr:peptidoglycan DD-metalloendopeptidase family protein [Leucobacter chromiiresistens]SDQ04802.1 Murein DD-endopeptidase MepM and murein hydrolase activator NlpD, contain LysM domain [Leucobacter chromiiresistens]SDQ05254.1 Murein DD-endopeptidase MepM and murein hydrolase activator NlpD, contain LysM domain [Leucobacter chromiiresistens]